MVSVIEATASLIIQIVVLALLLVAYSFKNQKKFRQHGITITAAVVLHIVTILYVMVPSLSSFLSSPSTITVDAIVLLSFIHVGLGLVAVALGIWLVASWRLRTDLQRCFANKRIMKPTLALWVTAILLGAIMYVVFWAASLL